MCNAHALALIYKCALALALRDKGALALAFFEDKSAFALVGKKFILLL